MVSTNFSKPSQVSGNYHRTVNQGTDVLLLETSDKLLLQNGTDNLLLEGGDVSTVNFSSITINSTNYS